MNGAIRGENEAAHCPKCGERFTGGMEHRCRGMKEGQGQGRGEGRKMSPPSEDLIRKRAYQIYIDRGRIKGYDVADWFEAKRELCTGEGGTRS